VVKEIVKGSWAAGAAFCLLLGLAGAPALGQSAAAQAAAAGFHEFEGSWSGSGTLSHTDGRTERLRCGADYVARGDVMSQRLRCRSDTTGFDLVNTLRNEGGRLAGEWSETTRNVRGPLAGRLGRGSMQGSAQGPGFSAGISVAVRGNRQSVSIRAQGGDIAAVSVALVRGR
jgi:hypothetical protein